MFLKCDLLLSLTVFTDGSKIVNKVTVAVVVYHQTEYCIFATDFMKSKRKITVELGD